jgi:hypothetical protein
MHESDNSPNDDGGPSAYEQDDSVSSSPLSTGAYSGPTDLPTRPFVHLNLRFNPFGEMDLSDRAELAVVDILPLIGRVSRPGQAIQFIGDKGRGKTTHLLALHHGFPEAPYIHLDIGWRGQIPQGHPLFIDEVQRVPRLQRQEVFSRPVSFILGTHVDYETELRRAGLEVQTIEPGPLLNADRLETILAKRIEWARRGPGPLPQVSRSTVEQLIKRFGDDVRAMEGNLYEMFQNLNRVTDV